MELLIWILHLLVAVGIIALVLLQHGKGADVGAAFGSGASGSLFGASGSANFLSRTTAVLATLFFLTSLGLTYYSAQKAEPAKPLPVPVQPSAPPAPAPATPGPGGQPVEIPR